MGPRRSSPTPPILASAGSMGGKSQWHCLGSRGRRSCRREGKSAAGTLPAEMEIFSPKGSTLWQHPQAGLGTEMKQNAPKSPKTSHQGHLMVPCHLPQKALLQTCTNPQILGNLGPHLPQHVLMGHLLPLPACHAPDELGPLCESVHKWLRNTLGF